MSMSIMEFVAKLAVVDSLAHHAAGEAVKKACKIVEEEAKDVIGSYRYDWPQLAQATQEDRVRQGFAANEPLLRTGELRDSIETDAPHRDRNTTYGFVGSKNPIAKYQEFGTTRIPPRPFIGGALSAKEKEIKDALGGHIFSEVFRK